MFQMGPDNKKWVQIEQRTMSSLLGAQIFFDQYSNFSWYLNGLRFRNLITNYQNQTLRTYVPAADFEFIANSLKPRFAALDKELVNGLAEISSTKYQRLNGLLRQIRRIKLSEMEDIDLANLFLDYYQVTVNELFLVNFKPLEIGAMEGLTEAVANLVKDRSEAQNVVSILSTMEKPSLSSREEIDLLAIVRKTEDQAKMKRSLSRSKDPIRLLQRNYKEIYDMFESHTNRYRYVLGGYSEIEYTVDDFINRYIGLLEMGPEWIEEQYKYLTGHTRKTSTKKRKILNKIKDKGAVKTLSKMISNLAMLGENNRVAYGHALEIRELLTTEICERVGLADDEIRFYTLSEILDLVRYRERLDEAELVRRTRGVVFSSSLQMYTSIEAKRFLENKVDHKAKRHVLKGRCASPGKYEGMVRVLNSPEDQEKVRQGDVVVTASTGYEFGESFRKAGAVIVESSGLLGPAAIICREIGIPCLIEAEGATVSLRDGDMVVVDALTEEARLASKIPTPRPAGDFKAVRIFDWDDKEPVVLPLQELTLDLAPIFGRKAVALAAMAKEDHLVPAGFAIGRSALYRFLESKGCKPNNGAYDPATVQKAREILMDSKTVDFLRSLPLDATIIFDEDGCAVRCSDLPGDNLEHPDCPSTMAIRTLEGLWKGIRKCWLSYIDDVLDALESADASNPPKMGGGVIIQQYKPGDRSGRIASQDFSHPSANILILEACLGSGHSLRSGKARPDLYRVSRKTERIINRVIPLKTRFEMVQPKTGKLILVPVPEDIVEAEVLTRLQIKTLVSSSLRTEKLLGYAVRIDWTIKGGDIYYLNVREIKAP